MHRTETYRSEQISPILRQQAVGVSMQMPGRSFSSEAYRWGFNGKEMDSEGMGGSGSTYDYGFRIYNAQIAKFLSVDPLAQKFAFYSPYQYAGNKPIWAIDLDGLEELVYYKAGYQWAAGKRIVIEIAYSPPRQFQIFGDQGVLTITDIMNDNAQSRTYEFDGDEKRTALPVESFVRFKVDEAFRNYYLQENDRNSEKSTYNPSEPGGYIEYQTTNLTSMNFRGKNGPHYRHITFNIGEETVTAYAIYNNSSREYANNITSIHCPEGRSSSKWDGGEGYFVNFQNSGTGSKHMHKVLQLRFSTEEDRQNFLDYYERLNNQHDD